MTLSVPTSSADAVGTTVKPMPSAMADATSVCSHTWDDFNVSSKVVGLAGSAGCPFTHWQADAPASQTHIDEPRPVSRAVTNADSVDRSDIQIVNYRPTAAI